MIHRSSAVLVRYNCDTTKPSDESVDNIGMRTRQLLHAALALPIIMTLLIFVGCETPTIDLGAPPVRVEKEREGTGRVAQPGDVVTIDYEVFLPDGTRVLGDTGFRFQLGAGAVISGIDEAVEGMRVGGERTIRCPPHRHWGRQGYGDGVIPPNTPLTIDIALTGVSRDDERARR